jgi:hypothetical protein
MGPNATQSRNFSWATLNPFAKADRGETTSAVSQPNPQRKEDNSLVDLNEDGTPKIKSKNPGESDDPMVQFDSLWQPNKDKDGKVIEEESPNNEGYLPKLDNKKLGELINKVNFTDGVTQAEFDAIKEGGDKATAAMFGIINKAARKAFTVSLNAASRLSEQGFANAQGRFLSEVPEHVRGLLTDNELSGSVGIMKNPAFATVVDNVKQQYLKKFPKAGPREVNSAIKQYFDYMASEITKKPEEEINQNTNTRKLKVGDPNADFMQWIEKDLPILSSQFAEGESAQN